MTAAPAREQVGARAGVVPTVLMELRGVGKRYGHVQALADVDLSLHPGEVVALVGDNGAGKSTLAKVITGSLEPDAGTVWFQDLEVRFGSPLDAKRLGIEYIPQTLGLFPNLDIAANYFVGREVRRTWFGHTTFFTSRVPMIARARQMMMEYGLDADTPLRLAEALSGGQRQLVAISRGADWGSTLIVADEPTAALGVAESQKCLRVLRQLRDNGTSVLVISHNLEHVFSIADRIAVLRHGRLAGVRGRRETSASEVVHLITGADHVEYVPEGLR